MKSTSSMSCILLDITLKVCQFLNLQGVWSSRSFKTNPWIQILIQFSSPTWRKLHWFFLLKHFHRNSSLVFASSCWHTKSQKKKYNLIVGGNELYLLGDNSLFRVFTLFYSSNLGFFIMFSWCVAGRVNFLPCSGSFWHKKPIFITVTLIDAKHLKWKLSTNLLFSVREKEKQRQLGMLDQCPSGQRSSLKHLFTSHSFQ